MTQNRVGDFRCVVDEFSGKFSRSGNQLIRLMKTANETGLESLGAVEGAESTVEQESTDSGR